ncbi:MAG: hypothetical protein HXX81_01275 [Campylobacterales bacterium]|nr:hypothetical protein [Campylobacterales bacterium]
MKELQSLQENSNNFTLIVTALHAEAKPLIEEFKLKKVSSTFEIFKNENIVLIVSSIGQINSIIATTHILSLFNCSKIINYGIAGAKNQKLNIGEFCLINKILEFESKKAQYLDLIFDFDFHEASLTTSNKAIDISQKDEIFTDLVDMESYWFYLTASRFLQNHQIFVAKVISDYLDTSIPTKEFVEELSKSGVQNLKKIIDVDFNLNLAITNHDRLFCDELSKKLKLSKTQSVELLNLYTHAKMVNRLDLFENIDFLNKNIVIGYLAEKLC